ncbi:unnamed protein product [Rotaria sordida]|uniref:Uncharacterized protein n=1 Tax=Rotaria sordida TaxID=392033 RepID=A0A814QRV5_9BILA|nr:unnamed protein product [Rotaria sordida]CAF1124040.1 unnamed protein product [Rotaria sordida]CAF1124943.1 unnamed protein product [Rotaria sordida]
MAGAMAGAIDEQPHIYIKLSNKEKKQNVTMNYPLFLEFEQYTPGKGTREKTVHDTIYHNLDSPREDNKVQLTLKTLPVNKTVIIWV